jgi:hypothetical protein
LCVGANETIVATEEFMAEVNFSTFSGTFIASLGGRDKIATATKNKILQACAEALQPKIHSVKTPPTIEQLANLLTTGKKEDKALAAKIAEALYNTPLYNKASLSVRRQIDSAMSWSGTWLEAKFSGFSRILENRKEYGADSLGKQNAILNAALKAYVVANGVPTHERVQKAFELEIIKFNLNAKEEEEEIDRDGATRFFREVFLEEWKKAYEKEEKPQQPAGTLALKGASQPLQLEGAKGPDLAAQILAADPEETDTDAPIVLYEGITAEKDVEAIKEEMKKLSPAACKFLVRYAILVRKPKKRGSKYIQEGDAEISKKVLRAYKELVLDHENLIETDNYSLEIEDLTKRLKTKWSSSTKVGREMVNKEREELQRSLGLIE